MTIDLLFVDDDEDLLRAVSTRLWRKRRRFRVVTAVGHRGALDALAGQRFDAVVVDERLRTASGTVVLDEAARSAPLALRIAVWSDRGRSGAARAIRTADQVLGKPYDAESIASTVELASERLAALPAGVAERLAKLTLPPSPHVFAEVQRLTALESTSARDVARLIEEDLGLTTRVLRLANSAAFGARAEYDSLSAATSALGLDTIRDLVLAEQVMGNGGGRRAEHQRSHAMLAARIARCLYPLNRSVFMAALLHDIGFTLQEGSDEGAEHGLVGAYVLARWGFPAELVHAVAAHHDPESAPAPSQELARQLFVASALADRLELGETVDAQALSDFGVEPPAAELERTLTTIQRLAPVKDSGTTRSHP